MDSNKKRKIIREKDKRRKFILLACNILLIIIMLIGTAEYTRYIYKTQEEAQKEDFIRMIDSMKKVSQNHLNSERGYVKNWANYISQNDMTMQEALEFLRTINTDKNRFAHIIDMDTYEAYSSYYPEGLESIDTYVKYKDKNVEAEEQFDEIMQSMFMGTDEAFSVLGKYRLQETQAMGVGIGTRVTLVTDDGKKDYLILRIVPVDELKKSWVFPTEYSNAEIGIITRSGDYVIQSSSMKSLNFIEYIRGYNFQDDYNEGDRLRKKLETTDSGILEYKNFRDTDCLWYYSSFGSDSALDIIGVINVSDLEVHNDAWYIIILVFGTLVVLAIIDGIYLINMNHRLYEEAKASQQASRAKTQFLSAMSHDIRTPLNAVMGMMEIAKKKPDDAAYVKSCMDKGLRSGKQLLTLINDVLDISKIESGKLTLNSEQVSLVELMQDLEDMVKIGAAQKGITIKCDCASLTHKYVLADRMRLNQIYMNLLTNAIKYTDDDGKILIRLYEENITDNPLKTKLIFYIEDTGIGMTEEFQKNMYGMFSREINTQVNSTQGTGLGLSIVKQMVDLMEGTIDCESSTGIGTSFTISIDLPVIDECEVYNAEDVISQDIEGMRLMVVEDNELNWEIFKELVSDKGIICDHAENGKECIEMLTNTPNNTYSAILMDIHMPVMDGYEATRTIRAMEDDNISKIPIVAMTADAFAEDVQACINCGMNGHIAKPVSMDKLMPYLVKIKNNQI